MSNDASNYSEESMDLWRVRMPDGDVRVVTLERLDDLFQRGHITEQTMVLEEGATKWRTLGDVAGLGVDVEVRRSSHAFQPAPLFVAPPDPAARDMAAAMLGGSKRAAPMSAAPPPVVADIRYVDDLEYPRSSKKKKWLVVAAAMTLLGAGFGVAVTKVGGAAESSAAAAGAVPTSEVSTTVAAPPPPAQIDPPAKVDPPAPVADGKPQLTDEQRKTLLEADKAREARVAKKKGERLTARPPRRAPKSSTPFTKGGSKYDPLNGAL